PRLQRQSGGHAQSLLSASEENAAMNFSRPVQAGKLFVQNPRQLHKTKCLQVRVAKCGCVTNCPWSEHSLKHAGNLRAFGYFVQCFFRPITGSILRCDVPYKSGAQKSSRNG